MGRPLRQFKAGTIVHAYNRSVDRRRIFHTEGDYWAFIDLVQEGMERDQVRIFGYNVMPNHWHFMMQAKVDHGISRFMKWLQGTHVRRYRKFYGTEGEGHVYGDRFKSTVIEGEEHFWRAMRYVESNAARAQLVRFSDDWPWSSGCERRVRHRSILSDTPTPLPADWGKQLVDYVDEWLKKKHKL